MFIECKLTPEARKRLISEMVSNQYDIDQSEEFNRPRTKEDYIAELENLSGAALVQEAIEGFSCLDIY